MKIISLLLLLLTTQVFAGLENELSAKLEARLNAAFIDVPAGKYQIALEASYQYELTPNGTVVTLPVFLSTLKTYPVPEAFDSCQMDKTSLNCQATKDFIEWYERQAPPSSGYLIITAYLFEACQGHLCNFVKQATVTIDPIL